MKFSFHAGPPGAPGQSGLERRKPWPSQKERRKFKIKNRRKKK